MFEAKNISINFGLVQVLSGVSLSFEAGKVLAIIGENGAGKSTLMKILSGVYTDYEGDLLIDNQIVKFKNLKDAQDAGIAIIHQELNLIPDLSITENLFLGAEICNKFGMLDKATMLQKTQNLLKTVNLTAHPNTKIKDLKIGEQQLVEIAKALLADAQIIIMDEPTSAITGAEVQTIFEIIRSLTAAGKSIVYISHKLDELYAIAHNYAILRDGNLIETGEMQGITKEKIVNKMVGRVLSHARRPENIATEMPSAVAAKVLLEVQNFQLFNNKPNKFSNPNSDFHLTLHKGEILGVFGLMGSGRTELLESIFGIYNKSTIIIEGKKVQINSPQEAIKLGLALVTEDRKYNGILPELSLRKNISITVLDHLSKRAILSNEKERALSQKYIEKFKIKAANDSQPIKQLSGGNQQKAILAKWLATKPRILLLDEPTRGIDVNAKAEIYDIICDLAAHGMGIILVSSELPEILAISQRVIVLNQGKITCDIPVEAATEENLLKAAMNLN